MRGCLTADSATGVHSTCSMRGAPVASITSRSKPSAMPDAGGICRQRGEEILVDRIALAMHALLLGHLALEAAALLGRVGELAEGIGDLDAADIKLEAFGDARVMRGRARERRFGHRILVEDRGAADPEVRLDALDQHAAEHVGPGVVSGDADAPALSPPRPARRGRRASASRSMPA